MVDPLGTAASVAGLISLGLQTVEYLYKFYSAYRDQDEALGRIADKLSDLLGSLQNIEQVIQARQSRPGEQLILQSIEKSITLCRDIISDLEGEASKFKKEPTDNWKKRVVVGGRRAAYPFKQDTLKDLSDDVDSFRGNLSIALQTLGLREHQNTQSDIRAIGAIVASTQNDVEEVAAVVKTIQAHNIRADLRQWLRAPDATVDFNTACSKRHAGTGQWLVQGPAFTDWLRRDNSFLWLYGFAGCGKSVLCTTAIQHALRHQRAQHNRAIAFFFFTFRDEAKQDASAMLRALLLQLAGQVPGLEAELSRLQESYKHGTPPVSVLIEYLRQAIERSRQVYILLDALDESPVETARKEVLDTIKSMRGWQLPGLHLLVTSRDRDAPDIRISIRSVATDDVTNHIPLKNDSVQHDIARYVSYQVEHDEQLQRWSEQQRTTIEDHLIRHADGV